MVSQTLTHFVNPIAPGSQLQGLRSYRVRGGRGYIFSFDFYPWDPISQAKPRSTLFLGAKEGLPYWTLGEKSQIVEDLNLEIHDCPLLIFAKSHLKNKKILNVSLGGTSEFFWDFEGGERFVAKVLDQKSPPILECLILIPGRPRDFKSQIELAIWSLSHEKNPVASEQKIESKKLHKQNKLEQNIQKDVQIANEKFSFWQEFAKSLETESESSKFLSHSIYKEAVTKKEISPWKNEKTWDFLDSVYKQKKKYEKKYLGAKLRLETFKSSPVLQKTTKESGTQKKEVNESRVSKPQKKPGIWVQSPWEEGLWARVGRNSKENDELFRQAKDRDLWFHIRTLPGGHVWIPRGQPGFGSKSDPTDKTLKFGAQLALLNSKAKESAKGGALEVEYTERRNLKKTKGLGPGKILVIRAETRIQRLDSEFESLIKGA